MCAIIRLETVDYYNAYDVGKQFNQNRITAMKQINKVIEVTKCSNKKYWYAREIGLFTEVIDFDKKHYMKAKHSLMETLQMHLILKKDCEFRYMSDNECWGN